MRKLLVPFLSILCLVCIVYNLFSTIYSQKDRYISHDYWSRYPQLQQVYINSQYVNKHPLGWVPDETVNAYAGGAYVRGIGPHLIAPDTPPLGRYLIGASALIFGNENVVILIASVISLVFLYLLGTQIFRSKLTALLAPLLVSFEPFFKNQLVYTPLLDILQLAFLLIAFFLFNLSNKKQHPWVWYILSSFFLGCFIATKFFITGFLVAGAWLLVLLLWKQFRNVLFLIGSFLISIAVLLFSYIRAFAYGYSFRSFLGIQKWVFLYHKSQLILPLSIWPLLYLNKWYVWFGEKPVLSDAQWMITWPIGMTVALLTTVLYVMGKMKKNFALESIMIWIILYIAFFSFGQITSRYLIIYLPVVYIVALYGIEHVWFYVARRYENRH